MKQQQLTYDHLLENQPIPGEFTFFLAGKAVCWKACMTKGITECCFHDLKVKFREGARFSVHGNKEKFKEPADCESLDYVVTVWGNIHNSNFKDFCIITKNMSN